MGRVSFTLAAAALWITACGSAPEEGPPCAGHPGVGTWRSGLSRFTMNDRCEGSETTCNSTFRVGQPKDGTVPLEILATNNNSGCQPVGTHTCAFQITGDTLAIDCGQGVVNYTRQ